MKNKNTLIWVGVSTFVVVGTALFFLVRANKKKLAREQWVSAGSPGTFEQWLKLTDAQKEELIASLNKPNQAGQISKDTTLAGIKIDTQKVGEAVLNLFKPVKRSNVKTGDTVLDEQLAKQTDLLEQYRQAQRKKSISSSLKTLQSQYGPGISVTK